MEIKGILVSLEREITTERKNLFSRSDSNLGCVKTTNNLPPRHIPPRCDAMRLAKSPMCLRFCKQKPVISNHPSLGSFALLISGLLNYSAPPLWNNCPPPPRKSPEPLENSITGLHERFKIMVLSLCEERERTWPPAAARSCRSVTRA